jgi:hypothetical protein
MKMNPGVGGDRDGGSPHPQIGRGSGGLGGASAGKVDKPKAASAAARVAEEPEIAPVGKALVKTIEVLKV